MSYPNDREDLDFYSNGRSRDAGAYEAGRYSNPAPQQTWETNTDYRERLDAFTSEKERK
ncbi:MAG: hypothetical protein ACOY7P_15565 [Pseudomonadota bacterium]